MIPIPRQINVVDIFKAHFNIILLIMLRHFRCLHLFRLSDQNYMHVYYVHLPPPHYPSIHANNIVVKSKMRKNFLFFFFFGGRGRHTGIPCHTNLFSTRTSKCCYFIREAECKTVEIFVFMCGLVCLRAERVRDFSC